jgi:hypothetical protein
MWGRILDARLKRQEQLARKVANLLLIRGVALASANLETYYKLCVALPRSCLCWPASDM